MIKYETEVHRAALRRMLAPCCTGARVDRQIQYAALVYARAIDREADFWEIYHDTRTERLDWLAVTQRKWQAYTANPARARHHDSVSIREKYVRCIP